MTLSIVDFLKQRIEDDEQQALQASPGPWHLNAEHDEVIAVDDIEVCTAFALNNNQLRNTARHIALHDPARVLREVTAKRAIVDAHPEGEDGWCGDEVALTGCRWEKWPCPGLRHLAAIYDSHPDYREEWKP